ncbi:1A family penicillin-binding protein [Paenisporosarcina sp. HGH0030]|uniref:transglycosylase domain-containing protein n=1 Tax=Paenisporosarcina sp. HGH0030 TaxID=1078085 RepID=UPI00034E2AFA|nr:PBP1A family penicillin-binding protein [Paenisporosarcina sp. HGH0030]EPD51206.1 1A family penicillin-binding protein [Paenisporosarcina sp. HGH0030]
MRRADLQQKKRKHQKLRSVIWYSIVSISALCTILLALRIYAQILGPPSLAVPQATVFLDRNGHSIGDRFAEQRRYWVKLEEMSPFISDAILAVEDQEFYEHHGFDYTRIATALLKDVKAMKKVEGASTITQQYARNLYLTHDKTWTRKAKEALFAYRMETFYEKDELLEGYLNTVYFGHGMYGVEAASRFYFGKPSKDLTLAESALLISIPKGPSIYSPLINEENAYKRQNIVLGLMESQEMVSTEAVRRARDEQIVLKNEEWKGTKSVAPYFLDEAWAEADRILAKKGRAIAEGGWTIETTLNTQHQKVAEEVVADWMPKDSLEVGFVSMEPETGYVTALIGGRSYSESSFNRVTQAKRQPGSTIKPLLYAAALEEGFSPLTFLESERTIFTYDNGRSQYEPKNVNGEFANHPISLAQAIAISDNIYAVKTLEKVGYKPFESLLKRLGVETSVQETPAMALGTSEVTLKDLTGAFNKIANGGIDQPFRTVLSIRDSHGEVVFEADPKERDDDDRVMSAQDAFILTHLMTGMFDPVFNDYAPATGLSIRGKQTRPYAAKSGTTISDQVLVGYTPTLTTGVWNGYDAGKQLQLAEDKQATKNIWIDYMERVHQGVTAEPFLPPKGVTGVIVDIETGGLAVSACTKQRLMYVKKEDIPKRLCTDPKLQKQLLEDVKTNEDADEVIEMDSDDPWSLFPFSFFRNDDDD